MDAKRDAEEKRLRGTLADLQSSIQRRLDELEKSENVEQLRLFDTDERLQFDADVRALRHRIERIGEDVEAEVAVLRHRYAVRDVNWFPVAVEFLVPLAGGVPVLLSSLFRRLGVGVGVVLVGRGFGF